MGASDPRYHSAEHILTAVLGNLYNGRILDARFKGNKSRCDYAVETDASLEDIIEKVGNEVNKIIAEHRETTFEEVSLEEAKSLCSLHRLPDGIERVRIVRIGDNVITPCRGEHVKNTSEIGSIEIRTYNYIETGIIRLTFVVK